MALYDGSYFHARFVGHRQGRKVFGLLCGESLCTGSKFNARQVAAAEGAKVFAMASEGCTFPFRQFVEEEIERLDATCHDAAAILEAARTLPTMVEAEHLPPYGLGRVIRILASGGTGCLNYQCRAAYLIYQGPETGPTVTCTEGDPPATIIIPAEHGLWAGCFEGIDIKLWIDETQPPGEEIRVCLSGSCVDDPDVVGTQRQLGYLPYSGCTLSVSDLITVGGVTNIFLPGGCCEPTDCELPELGLLATTYCGSYLMGRHVVNQHGRKVFAVQDCRPLAQCNPGATNCCTMLAHCCFDMTIEGSECTCFNATYTVCRTEPLGSESRWQHSSGSGTCSGAPQLTLTCESLGDEEYLWCIEVQCGPQNIWTGCVIVSGGQCGPVVIEAENDTFGTGADSCNGTDPPCVGVMTVTIDIPEA